MKIKNTNKQSEDTTIKDLLIEKGIITEEEFKDKKNKKGKKNTAF